MSAPAVLRTLCLEQPIKRGDTSVAALTLRKPMAGELRGVSLAELAQMKTDAVMAVLPRISDPVLIPEEVAQLDPADLFACGVEIASFFLTKAQMAEATPI